MPTRKGNHAAAAGGRATTEEPQSKRQVCEELDHPDDEEFDSRSFPWHELIPEAMGNFDPHLKNAGTGSKFNKIHHFKGEGWSKRRKDFLKFEYCFCLEWIKTMIGGKPYWVRCLNMFNLRSYSCCDHSKVHYKDGPNRVYNELAANRTCNWGMLKNIYLEHEPVEFTVAEKLAEEEAKVSALGEQIAVMSMGGQEANDLVAEQQERMQRMSRMPKDSFLKDGDDPGMQLRTSKAMPASSDGLHMPRGATTRPGMAKPETKAQTNTKAGKTKKGNQKVRAGQAAWVRVTTSRHYDLPHSLGRPVSMSSTRLPRPSRPSIVPPTGPLPSLPVPKTRRSNIGVASPRSRSSSLPPGAPVATRDLVGGRLLQDI